MGAYEKQQVPGITSSSQRSINNDSTDTWFYDGATALVAKNNCRIIARIFPYDLLGSVGRIKAKTYIESTSLSFGTLPLVQRHYNIDDSQAAPNGRNIVTLYFSNADFTNYNARVDAFAKLPATADSDPIQNVRILHFRANSLSGTPESYNLQPDYIYPVSVTWLTGAATWQVIISLPAVGLGGFFLTAVKDYEFIGNGNWSIGANWRDNERPPAILPSNYNIFIAPDKHAILDIPQALAKNAVMYVRVGGSLTVQSELSIDGNLNTNTGIPFRNTIIHGQ